MQCTSVWCTFMSYCRVLKNIKTDTKFLVVYKIAGSIYY